MTDEICFADAHSIHNAVMRGDWSPTEIVDSVAARIDAVEGSLNAFVEVDLESAREAAQRLESAIADGRPRGPLAGVPVTIKDLTDVAGMPTRLGSHTTAGHLAPASAPVVTRLEDAGAIVIGKTTTPEFGWKGVSQSPLTGITSNPWRHGFNAGASSAGAAVAAASGMGALHQGSDGAGSIRMPAHFSGVVGLKPTYGRVPYVPMRNNDWASHIGPITRTVTDAAIMLRIMSGPHPRDHATLDSEPLAYDELLASDPATWRVAFSPDLGHARVDHEIATVVRAAVSVFETLGCRVEELTPRWGPEGPELARFFWAVHEAPLAGLLETYAAQMDPGLAACIRAGQGHSAEEYLAMRGHKIEYAQRIHATFDSFDFLLTPAVSVAAFPADRLQPEHWPDHPWDWLSWAEFSYPFNLSGNPAVSVPCGFTATGLPVGLQIVGPRLGDLEVLQAARAYEAAAGGFVRPPDPT